MGANESNQPLLKIRLNQYVFTPTMRIARLQLLVACALLSVQSAWGQDLVLDWVRPQQFWMAGFTIVENDVVVVHDEYKPLLNLHHGHISRFSEAGSRVIDLVPFDPQLSTIGSIRIAGDRRLLVGFFRQMACPEGIATSDSLRCLHLMDLYDVEGRHTTGVYAQLSADSIFSYRVEGGPMGRTAVLGTLWGAADFDADGVMDADAGDEGSTVVAVYEEDGSVRWSTVVPDSEPYCYTEPILTSDGGVYYGCHALGQSRVVYRIDGSGRVRWSKPLNFGRTFRGAPTSDGGLYVAANLALEPGRSREAVVRLDTAGNVISTVELAGYGRWLDCVDVEDVAVDDLDRLYLVARFLGDLDLDDDGEIDLESRKAGDCLDGFHSLALVGYEHTGAVRFAESYGGAHGTSRSLSLRLLGTDALILGGSVHGQIDLDNDGVPESGSEFIGQYTFLARYNIVSTSDSEAPPLLHTSVSVYPNPASGAVSFRVATERSASVRVDVFDVLGRRVATIADAFLPAGESRYEWDTRWVAAGTYIYRLSSGQTAVTGRVVVTR